MKHTIAFALFCALLAPPVAHSQWGTVVLKSLIYLHGDPGMKVVIQTDRPGRDFVLDISVTNKHPKRIMRFLKIKIDRTLLDGFDITGYHPPPAKKANWGPLRFAVKYRGLIQLAPGENEKLQIVLRPKKKGTFKGEISVHALKGYFSRFTPAAYAIVLKSY